MDSMEAPTLPPERAFLYRAARRMRRLLFSIKKVVASICADTKLDYDKESIRILTDNYREFNTRANSCAKEPETVKWLEEHFTDDAVLYDVGANIGAYSLIASKLARTQGRSNRKCVFAFEPAYPNYSRLCQNVTLNGVDDVVSAFPISLSNATKIGGFRYLEAVPGTSKCFYNDGDRYHLKFNDSAVTKASLVYRLDDFISQFSLPVPTMLKVDVDGGEAEVIEGATLTVQNHRLRTIIIEIDNSLVDGAELRSRIEANAFKLVETYPRSPTVTNYIFTR